MLEQALPERSAADPTAAVLAAPRPAARAGRTARSRRYTLVATNPPFLGTRKAGRSAARVCRATITPTAKADLATCVHASGCRTSLLRQAALPWSRLSNWLFLTSYTRLASDCWLDRRLQADCASWEPGRSVPSRGEVVNAIALDSCVGPPERRCDAFTAIDVSAVRTPEQKREAS